MLYKKRYTTHRKQFRLKEKVLFAMQKGGFCVAKTTLLPRKNRVFQMPNNELCKALIQKQLHREYIYEKHLHQFEHSYKPKTKCREAVRYKRLPSFGKTIVGLKVFASSKSIKA